MKYLLLLCLSLSLLSAQAQTKDPIVYPARRHPYRSQLAVADSNSHAFKGANTIAIRTGRKPAAALAETIRALQHNGFALAYSNADSLTFSTLPKALPAWTKVTNGAGVWGRVFPDGTVWLYPFCFSLTRAPLFWYASGRVSDSPEALPWVLFSEAEQVARAYQGGRLTFLRTK